MSELVSDEVWQRALLIIGGDIDLKSRASESNRERIEAACTFLRANTHATGKAMSFGDAAEAGRTFVSGLHWAEKYMSWIRMVEAPDSPAKQLESKFDDDFFERAELAIKMLSSLQWVNEEFERRYPGKIGGRNSKPYLHSAVGIAHEVWIDLRGHANYKRKDFLEFARVCLEPSRANITDHAVAESFDRHLKPRLRPRETAK